MTKVFVAMSGGVDSSVAAALLKEQGYDVVGVFMQGWSNPHFECTWRSDRQDAVRVAATLGIPFQTLDFSREYYERVVAYLLEEYRIGCTPNPDVMCNKEIKFGLFYRWAMEQGADYIATGHYVRAKRVPRLLRFEKVNEAIVLRQAKDLNKDQTYFLWTLTPEIISHALFPIGDYTKSEVRALARKFGLPTADKKDSQGICFVGEGNIADFLRDYIQTRRGAVITADGRKVGEHDGVELFTIGQRHGLGVQGQQKPLYVAEKNAATNTLVVARGHDDPILYRRELIAENVNWISRNPPEFPLECFARIRYRQPLQRCVVNCQLSNVKCSVVFDDRQRAVAPGQSVVFYKDDQLLGGGVIGNAW